MLFRSENPLYGGEAVYNARALLKLYIEDDASTVSRKLKPEFYLHENVIQNKEIDDFTVYPNPTSDQFTLSIYRTITHDGFITVTNQLGMKVELIKIMANSMEEKVNTTDLEPGLYFVSVQDGKECLGTKKIAIIR